MGHGTAVQDIGELLPLAVAQLRWSPAAMPLKQPFIAMLVPRSDPSVNAGAIHLQTLGDLTGGPPLDTEHDGLQAQNHPGRAIRLSFLPQSLEPLERARIAAGEDRLHESGACCITYTQAIPAHSSAPAQAKTAPSHPNSIFGNTFRVVTRALWQPFDAKQFAQALFEE